MRRQATVVHRRVLRFPPILKKPHLRGAFFMLISFFVFWVGSV